MAKVSTRETLKSKTFWTGFLGILGAVAGYNTGVMPMGDAVQTGITSLLAIFLRHGIAKQDDPEVPPA